MPTIDCQRCPSEDQPGTTGAVYSSMGPKACPDCDGETVIEVEPCPDCGDPLEPHPSWGLISCDDCGVIYDWDNLDKSKFRWALDSAMEDIKENPERLERIDDDDREDHN